MLLIRTFLVVFLVKSALSEDPLVRPCSKNDIACLTQSAQTFLEKTSAGVPEIDIKPIDPMDISNIETILDSGTKVNLKNVRITNLKKLIIKDFSIDTNKKSVVLTMDDDPEIVADIVVESTDDILTFTHTGKFSAKGKVNPTAKYNYDLVPNDKGVEYFTVGPETITCEVKSPQEITLRREIEAVLYKDSAKTEEIKKQIVCSVITPAFKTIIHNLRRSATIYPKTYYFTDL